MTAAADLSHALTDAQLDALRAHYDAALMFAASRAAIAVPHPPSAGYVNWIIDNLYSPERMAPRDRERTLVALLASQTLAPSRLLAVHLYWALMEGLPLPELCDTLSLAGVYTGLPHFTAALSTLRTTVDALTELLAKPGVTPDTRAVVAALSAKLA